MTIRSTLIRTFSLLPTLFLFASSASAAWVIDLSGTLVNVDELALSSAPLTVAQVGKANLMPNKGDKGNQAPTEQPGGPGNIELETGLSDLEAKRQNLRETYQKNVELRSQNLEKNQLTIRTQVMAEEDGLKVRQETVNRDGKVLQSKDTVIPKEEKLRLERENDVPVEISSTKQDELVVESTRTRTRTNFPLSIGEDNTLMVTHPDGTTKSVTVLPDQAVANLEQKGFVTAAEPELTIQSEEAVYEVPVKEEKRFLGLFKVVFDKRAEVSAESGEVESKLPAYVTAWQRFLERFSF